MPYQSVNPATGELLQTFEEHSNQQVLEALAAADKAYRGFWSTTPYEERANHIARAATLMLEQKEALARLATIEMGKRIAESRGEVELSAAILKYYADNAEKFLAPRKLNSVMFLVKDEDEAITLANNSPFGLGGSVYTTNIEHGKRVASRIETGMVFINYPTISAPDLPFGGVKRSGYGKELSNLGIEEFINKKLICVATGASLVG